MSCHDGVSVQTVNLITKTREQMPEYLKTLHLRRRDKDRNHLLLRQVCANFDGSPDGPDFG